jgi:geranylgeranyl diphosphate synthase, type III
VRSEILSVYKILMSLRYFVVESLLLSILISDELIALHRGQGMEIFWRDNLTCRTIDEYIEVVNNKTSGLLRLAIRLMQEFSSSDVYYIESYVFDSRDHVPVANLIGILF